MLRIPREQGSWDQHGSHLGPVGPRWAPCCPHEPCYQGGLVTIPSMTASNFDVFMLALQWSTVGLLLMWEERQLHKQRPITSLMISTRSSVPVGLHWLGTTASTCITRLPTKPQSPASRLATGILVVLLALVSGNWIEYYEVSQIMSHVAWWCVYVPMKMCILLMSFDNVVPWPAVQSASWVTDPNRVAWYWQSIAKCR